MEINNYNDLEWADVLAKSDYIIVNYESEIDCEACSNMVEVFERLSSLPRYADVRFIRIDSKTNKIAEEYIKKRRLPFAAAFKMGILLECNSIKTESQLLEILERLLHIKLNF